MAYGVRKDPTPISEKSVSGAGTHFLSDDAGRKAETRSGKSFCKPFGMSEMYRTRSAHVIDSKGSAIRSLAVLQELTILAKPFVINKRFDDPA
jgi:hypothetical protein